LLFSNLQWLVFFNSITEKATNANEQKGLIVFSLCHRTYPALETLTEPHQLTATLSCMIGVARSLVSGGMRFPEGPTHMLPLLMRALPGVDPNDFSKCMVRPIVCSFSVCTLRVSLMFSFSTFTARMWHKRHSCFYRSHFSLLLHLWLLCLWWIVLLPFMKGQIWQRWISAIIHTFS